MGFFNLFEKKSSSETSLNKAVRSICEYVRPELGNSYTDAGSTAMYRGWVYVAASMNADAVSSSELKLYSLEKAKLAKTRQISKKELQHAKAYCNKRLVKSEEILEHPVLDLIYAPNDEDSKDSFIKKIDLFLELTGDAFVLVERDSKGLPIQMDVLYSQFMTVQTDGNGRVTHYSYGIPVNGVYQYNFTTEQIIHIKFFDPNNRYYGISPLQASARSVGLIDAMDTYEEALNLNFGVPSGILKYTNQKIREEDRSLIETKWNQKFSSVGRAGKTVVTDQDVSFESLGVSPREMQFLDGRKWSREEILACYRLPMAMLLTEGVNRSNMEQSSINYYKWTVRPRQQLIAQSLTKGLLKGTIADGKAFIAFEDDTPEDTDLLMQRSTILSANGAVTANELRRMNGLDEMDGLDIIVNTGGTSNEENN
jgi:HK97 family phage portal protein